MNIIHMLFIVLGLMPRVCTLVHSYSSPFRMGKNSSRIWKQNVTGNGACKCICIISFF